jgi:peptidyl-prolyl cis-trans isomerase B (cyclophilin B)
MSKRKTRERQLARYQARRESERRRRRRQRIVAAIVAFAIAGAGVVFAAVLIIGDGDPDPSTTPTATDSPSPTPSVSPTPSPTAEPVPVACDGEVPEAANTPVEDRPTFRRLPRLTVDLDATYTATVETSCGTMTIELLPRQAPYTVNSFVFLAERQYFDGLLFHRIANSIDVIQGGDPSCTDDADMEVCPGDEFSGPGYSIPDELFSGPAYEEGSVSMANAGANTGGSQFFIVTGPGASQLPASYTVFGEVTDGLDVAKQIQELEVGGTSAEVPQERVFIESVTVEVS